jgi:hypothetical protein
MREMIVRSLRELDALFAEKVLGWKWHDPEFEGEYKDFRLLVSPEDHASKDFCFTLAAGSHQYVKRYHEDLNAAIAGVKRLNQTTALSFALWSVCSISSVTHGWTAVLKEDVHPPTYERHKDCFEARHENPATAVVLACLRAKGVPAFAELTEAEDAREKCEDARKIQPKGGGGS